MYSFLFNNKIGSQLAIMFHAWASVLEQAGDTRKADTVYLQGTESRAQPVDWLQARHRYESQQNCPSFAHIQYTSCSKKVSHLMIDNNFGKCGPIFKILLPDES